jgi:hypothetical protein
VTVFITDMNYEPIAPYHFDLSGKAFGALAKPGLNDKLRHCGIMDLEFRRSLSFIDIARSIDRSSSRVCACESEMAMRQLTGSACRVRCKYAGGQKIVFHVEKGSNPNYLAVLVKFVADDGDIVQMELKEKASPEWKPMKLSWGAIWRMDTPKALKGPFSIRLTSESGKKLVATDVIPANWIPNTFYKSNIQF